jgi:hypothetical protein
MSAQRELVLACPDDATRGRASIEGERRGCSSDVLVARRLDVGGSKHLLQCMAALVSRAVCDAVPPNGLELSCPAAQEREHGHGASHVGGKKPPPTGGGPAGGDAGRQVIPLPLIVRRLAELSTLAPPALRGLRGSGVLVSTLRRDRPPAERGGRGPDREAYGPPSP